MGADAARRIMPDWATGSVPQGGAAATRLLVVTTASRVCGLPVGAVSEVMRPLPLMPLAGTAPFVRGLSTIRGEAVPVVDLGALFGDPGAEPPTRLVALQVAERR